FHQKIDHGNNCHGFITVLTGQQLHQNQHPKIKGQLHQPPAKHLGDRGRILRRERTTLKQQGHSPRRQQNTNRGGNSTGQQHHDRPLQGHGASTGVIASALNIRQHRQSSPTNRSSAN